MARTLFARVVFLASVVWPTLTASAQLAGSRAGAEGNVAGVAALPLLDRETAQSYIAIDGRAEVRVRATEIRIVLAVTGEGESAAACRDAVDATVAGLKEAWAQVGVAEDSIVVDFISILPRYEWKLEEQSGIDVGVEHRVGFRMQTNVHVAVPDEAQAQEVLTEAFAQNVTDIIAFDYWNGDLNEIKAEARLAAVDAAREKADVLLGAVFDDRPQPINVQEETAVHYPESLYQSFTSAVDQSVTPSFRRDIPFIRASRPQNTYYRGLYANADVQPRELPIKPEISIVSTVRIYFQSPAAKRAQDENDD